MFVTKHCFIVARVLDNRTCRRMHVGDSLLLATSACAGVASNERTHHWRRLRLQLYRFTLESYP